MRDLLDRIARLNPVQRALLERRLLQAGRKPEPVVGRIPKVSGEAGDCPLTHMQRRLWAFEQLYPGTPTYNVSWITSLTGPLDLAAAERSVQELVNRNITLRTTFHQTPDGPVQRFSRAARCEFKLARLEEGCADRRASAEQLLQVELRRAFDLTNGPLVRAMVIGLGEGEHWLVLTVHHLVTDGGSLQILHQELSEFYNAAVEGREPKLPDIDLDYRDFASWLASRSRRAGLSSNYWAGQISGAPALLELSTDHARQKWATWDGWNEPVPLSPTLLADLERRCRELGVTLYVLLIAAWAMLLQRYGCGDEIVIGSPLAGRFRPELQGMAGLMVNTLPLRIGLEGDPAFSALLRRVQIVVWGAVEHQDIAFDEAVEELRVPRIPGTSPIFQTAVAYLEMTPPPAFQGLRAAWVHLPVTDAHYDLMLVVNQSKAGIDSHVLLRRQLFQAATCRRMAGHLQRLLETLAVSPDQPISRYPLLSPAERQTTLALGAPADRPCPRAPVHVLFEEHARRTPDRVALRDRARAVTYAELSEDSNRIAAALAREGVGAGAVVAVHCNRSAGVVAAFLGVLKAGAAYLPIDADEPRERIQFLLSEASVKVMLQPENSSATRIDVAGVRVLTIDAAGPAPAPPSLENASPDDAAYVMFTSGTTGHPKAVVVPHRGIVRLVKNSGYARMDPGDVFLQLAPPAFDAATFEIWAPLLNGGCCAIYAGGRTELSAIGDAIRQYGVTTLWLTSSLFNAAMDEAPAILEPLDQLLIGGEALSVDHVTRALAAFPRTRIINGYGPTECTTFSCCYPIPHDFDASRTSVPIGMPIGNTQAYILDSQREPVPDGMPGELFIGGDGVALGYLNRPELTAQAFPQDPFRPGDNRRLYRTGDRARWLPDRSGIEFLGRLDNQLKIRGFRVEPGEVEAALTRLPTVAQAAVTAQPDSTGVKRLVGYVVPADGRRTGTAGLREALAARLPGYMIPAQFVLVDRLPLRPNGKIDHAALAPPAMEAGREETAAPPRDDLERDLVAIWRDILGLPEAGITDDFFERGGDSLLALRLIARVERQFRRSVPAATLLAAPTVELFARMLRDEAGDTGVTVVTPGSGKPALFWIDPSAALGKLANRLGSGQPFFGVTLTADELAGLRRQPPRLEDIAEALAVKIERRNPGGPLMVASFCLRTMMAVETARVLRHRGHSVPLLILVDPTDPEQLESIRSPGSLPYLASRAVYHLRRLRKLEPGQWGAFLQGRAAALRKRLGMQLWPHRPGFHNVPMERPMLAAAARHQVQPIDVALLVLRCLEPELLTQDRSAQSWTRLALEGISVRSIPGGHVEMFDDPYVTEFARVLREEIDRSAGG